MALTNGRANGNGAHSLDHTKLREEAGQISEAVVTKWSVVPKH